MNKTLKYVAAGVLALGMGAGAASAATMTGRIAHIYPKRHEIVLNKHLVRMTPKTFNSVPLRHGEKLHVTYHWSHGHRWATALRTV